PAGGQPQERRRPLRPGAQPASRRPAGGSGADPAPAAGQAAGRYRLQSGAHRTGHGCSSLRPGPAAAGAPAQAAPRQLPPAADAGGAAAGPVASGGGRGRARPPGARATQGPGHLVPGGRGARPVRQHHRRPPGPRRVLRPGGRLRAGPESAGLRQAAHHRQLPADRAYRGPPAGTAQRAALAGGDAELARTAPGAASVHSANGGRKSADRPTATANKKPATKRRGLFVGWSTQTRWPPSVASAIRNRRPGKRRLPYRKQTKKPATERRGLFVGWSTQMRWPPSVASAIRNRRPGKRRLPYRKQTKKPATKGRGLFVGWSTRMRWPPSSASEHPVIGGREN